MTIPIESGGIPQLFHTQLYNHYLSMIIIYQVTSYTPIFDASNFKPSGKWWVLPPTKLSWFVVKSQLFMQKSTFLGICSWLNPQFCGWNGWNPCKKSSVSRSVFLKSPFFPVFHVVSPCFSVAKNRDVVHGETELPLDVNQGIDRDGLVRLIEVFQILGWVASDSPMGIWHGWDILYI